MNLNKEKRAIEYLKAFEPDVGEKKSGWITNRMDRWRAGDGLVVQMSR